MDMGIELLAGLLFRSLEILRLFCDAAETLGSEHAKCVLRDHTSQQIPCFLEHTRAHFLYALPMSSPIRFLCTSYFRTATGGNDSEPMYKSTSVGVLPSTSL